MDEPTMPPVAETPEFDPESILDSVKKYLGNDPSYDYFDPDIIMLINAGISKLVQLGVGPADGFEIADRSSKWSDLIGDRKNLLLAKTYLCIDVKLVFDPPANSFLVNSLKEIQNEAAWRITCMVDSNNDKVVNANG